MVGHLVVYQFFSRLEKISNPDNKKCVISNAKEPYLEFVSCKQIKMLIIYHIYLGMLDSRGIR